MEKGMQPLDQQDASPKLLVIEDSPIEQRIYTEFLHQRGYHVHIANTGEKALKQFQKEHYDLILSDIGLPGIEGDQVCRKIRQLESKTNTHTPMIAITAYGDSLKNKCYQAGFDDFLEKPLSLDNLEAVLSHWIPSLPKNLSKNTKQKI